MFRLIKKPINLMGIFCVGAFCVIGLIAIIGSHRNFETPLTVDEAETVFVEMEDALNKIAAYLVASPSSETLYLRKIDMGNYPKELQDAAEDYYKAQGDDSLIIYMHHANSDIITFPLQTYNMGHDEEGALIYITQYFVYFNGVLPENWSHELTTAIKSDARGAWQLNDHWLFASLRN